MELGKGHPAFRELKLKVWLLSHIPLVYLYTHHHGKGREPIMNQIQLYQDKNKLGLAFPTCICLVFLQLLLSILSVALLQNVLA